MTRIFSLSLLRPLQRVAPSINFLYFQYLESAKYSLFTFSLASSCFYLLRGQLYKPTTKEANLGQRGAILAWVCMEYNQKIVVYILAKYISFLSLVRKAAARLYLYKWYFLARWSAIVKQPVATFRIYMIANSTWLLKIFLIENVLLGAVWEQRKTKSMLMSQNASLNEESEHQETVK